MPRSYETRLSIPCSDAQKKELEQMAKELGVSTIANVVRLKLGWPLEQQGQRKDLTKKPKK